MPLDGRGWALVGAALTLGALDSHERMAEERFVNALLGIHLAHRIGMIALHSHHRLIRSVVMSKMVGTLHYPSTFYSHQRAKNDLALNCFEPQPGGGSMRVSAIIERVYQALESRGRDCSLEELIQLCPELSWNKVYLAADYLVKFGRVRLTLGPTLMYRAEVHTETEIHASWSLEAEVDAERAFAVCK